MTSEDELKRVARYAAEAVADKTPTMREIETLVDKAASKAARDATAESREMVKEAAVAAAEAAVTRTLIGFGLDPNNRMEVLKDLMFLNEMRTLSSASKRHIVLAVMGVITTAIMSGTFAYLKSTGKL